MKTPLYAIQLQTGKCLRSLGASCSRCIVACPVNALTPGPTILWDEELCAHCGLCLHVCPTNVFAARDEYDLLLQAATLFLKRDTIEFICSYHPAPEEGIDGCDNAFKTANCLAALGPSTYLALWAIGVKRIILRLDACDTCPRGLQGAEGSIRDICSASEKIIRPDNPVLRIELIENPPEEAVYRPVHLVSDTSISRRGLLRSLLGQNSKESSGSKASSSDRSRMLDALEALASNHIIETGSFAALAFFEASIDNSCSACLACARVCPVGAFRGSFTANGRFQLEFAPALCLDCKLCIAACRQKAINRQPLKTATNVRQLRHHVIFEGEVRTCLRCRTKFRSLENQYLCPACAFRRQNPFGAIATPPIKGTSS